MSPFAPLRSLLVLVLVLVSVLLPLVSAPFGAVDGAAAPVAWDERTYWPTAGWRTADPADRGMDPALLAEADAQVAATLPYLTSLLVVRGGDLVFERYYGGFAADLTLDVWSATKSVTSIAVGIAIADGTLTGLDQTVGELIPGRIPAGADPRAADVTVGQLLTMTGGFTWDARTDWRAIRDDVDQGARTLGLPFATDPGGSYEYNSGAVHLLSAMLQVASGETLADYLQPRLFDPLGIARPVWRQVPPGESHGATGLELTPRDLAKIGYLYLNGGVWDGLQIVPADWVGASTTIQSSGDGYTSGVNLAGAGYGFLWWVTETSGYPAYVALGLGEQIVYVVPGLDLVVVATTSNAIPDEIPIEQQQAPRPLIEGFVVPAALAG